MSSAECKKCGAEYPSARKEVAKYLPNLCINCATDVDNLIKVSYSSVPTHKGAYLPVRTKKDVYNLTCNPKNYDHEHSEKLS